MKNIYFLILALCFCTLSGCKTTKTNTPKQTVELRSDLGPKPEGTITTHKGEIEPFYGIAETPVSFNGGSVMYTMYIKQNLTYPAKARERKITGNVFVAFIVEKTGHISNVEITKSADPLLDKAALDFVKNMPKWTPATINGKAVNFRTTLPIVFR